MTVRYYDDALINKIKNWVIDPKMKFISPSDTRQLFAINSDIDQDAPLSLPLIVLSRDSYCEVTNPNKRALSYDGGHLKVDEKRSAVLNAIPIKISYELSIYTRYFDEADEYARNFIFNLINYPSVDINIPYQNANITHRSTIDLDGRVTDNSNQSNRLAHDQFSRVSITFEINDAYLFSIPIVYNYEVYEDAKFALSKDMSITESGDTRRKILAKDPMTEGIYGKTEILAPKESKPTISGKPSPKAKKAQDKGEPKDPLVKKPDKNKIYDGRSVLAEDIEK